MELSDFILPQWAQFARLRELAHAMSLGKPSSSRLSAELQTDVNTLALVCMGLVATLVEKGVISELDLEMQMRALDALDADEDEGLDPNELRGALGLKKVKRKALPVRAKLKKKQPRGGPVPKSLKPRRKKS